MGKIFLEGGPAHWITTPVNAGHLYLVYRDDSGNEFVIRGGPGADFNLLVEAGKPIGSSAADRLVGHIDATLGEHIFNIAIAEGKSEIQPDGMLDD